MIIMFCALTQIRYIFRIQFRVLSQWRQLCDRFNRRWLFIHVLRNHWNLFITTSSILFLVILFLTIPFLLLISSLLTLLFRVIFFSLVALVHSYTYSNMYCMVYTVVTVCPSLLCSVISVDVLTCSLPVCQNWGRASWATRAKVQRPARWFCLSRCWGWWRRPKLCPDSILQGQRHGLSSSATDSIASLQYISPQPCPRHIPPKPIHFSRAWKSC